jgi:antitoxin VapB
MALNIKNEEVERLAAEVARMARETKTEAIRRALEDRRNRLTLRAGRREDRLKDLTDFLEREIWSRVPADVLGKKMGKQEKEEILGIGPEGYPEQR